MLIGLKTQRKLKALTDKNPDNLSIHLRALNIFLPLGFKDEPLYYEGTPSGVFLFSSSELAQIHRI